MISSLQVFLKDLWSWITQRIGMPHNRTSQQILAIKNSYKQGEIENLRIVKIAQATKKSESRILELLGEMDDVFWDELYSSRVWNERGGSMMSLRDRKTLYTLVRALNPLKIVETGVAGGASSTCILYALRDSRNSFLTSIDIKGVNSDFYGELIPKNYRSKWELCLQEKEPILRNVLQKIGSIDFFLHDSRHTVDHMTWEYEMAWSYLNAGGCLSSHDIIATSAFTDFAKKYQAEIAYTGCVANFGFFIKT